jgi:hypothetical protein
MNTAAALGAGGLKSTLHLPELGTARMLRCRVRRFTDGAVIGSKEFVNEAFASAGNAPGQGAKMAHGR